MKLLEFVKKVPVEDRGMPKLFPWQEKLMSEIEKSNFYGNTAIEPEEYIGLVEQRKHKEDW